jgi:hypothetical protein
MLQKGCIYVFLWFSEQTGTISINIIDYAVMETWCVFFEVETEFLNSIYIVRCMSDYRQGFDC